MAEKLNLHQKIVEVRKSIGGLHRDNAGHNYKYVSGSQILSKIIDKMNELGLVLAMEIVDGNHEAFHYVNRYGDDKVDFITTGHVIFRWVNADNPEDTWEIPFMFFGQQDEISKSFGSGLTYTERYFLLKFFNQPTDDEDPDAKSKSEIAKQARKEYKQQTITKEQAKELDDELVKRGIDPVTILEKYQIGTLNELTYPQFTKMLKAARERPVVKK